MVLFKWCVLTQSARDDLLEMISNQGKLELSLKIFEPNKNKKIKIKIFFKIFFFL